jgi:putative FmdB family regulatory protein
VPTYQYACTECSHAFEQFQSFSEDALTVCPQCQGRLRKVYNAVGVVFKGSGFYRTDSRADAKAGAGSSNGAGDTTKSDASTGTSDSSTGTSDSSTKSTPAASGSTSAA